MNGWPQVIVGHFSLRKGGTASARTCLFFASSQPPSILLPPIGVREQERGQFKQPEAGSPPNGGLQGNWHPPIPYPFQEPRERGRARFLTTQVPIHKCFLTGSGIKIHLSQSAGDLLRHSPSPSSKACGNPSECWARSRYSVSICPMNEPMRSPRFSPTLTPEVLWGRKSRSLPSDTAIGNTYLFSMQGTLGTAGWGQGGHQR